MAPGNRERELPALEEETMKAKVRRILSTVAGLAAALTSPVAGAAEAADQVCHGETGYVNRLLGSDVEVEFCDAHLGKVVLVVNTASRCAFTGQYEGLERLYAEYRERGFEVAGFPSNDFGGQEPGSEAVIKDFCRLTYGVRFPMYAKTRVRGENANPLFKALAEAAGHGPRWNFHKYLIDREGRLAGSYSSFVKPGSDELRKAIEGLL